MNGSIAGPRLSNVVLSCWSQIQEDPLKGGLLVSGGQGRNRTTDTRIFNLESRSVPRYLSRSYRAPVALQKPTMHSHAYLSYAKLPRALFRMPTRACLRTALASDPCLRRATLIDGVNRGIWGKGAGIAEDRVESGPDSTGWYFLSLQETPIDPDLVGHVSVLVTKLCR